MRVETGRHVSSLRLRNKISLCRSPDHRDYAEMEQAATGVAFGRDAGHNGAMTKGEQLLADMRRARRNGDPRLDDADRAILRRLTYGDLADEFAEALAQDVADDDLLGGAPPDHE